MPLTVVPTAGRLQQRMPYESLLPPAFTNLCKLLYRTGESLLLGQAATAPLFLSRPLRSFAVLGVTLLAHVLAACHAQIHSDAHTLRTVCLCAWGFAMAVCRFQLRLRSPDESAVSHQPPQAVAPRM